MVDGNEKECSIPVMSHRNTAHFCLNGAVESHAYGAWDETKYAVLMPLVENKDKIVGGTECDLFSIGSVPITDNAYILCPESELEVMGKANPDAKIIGYVGSSVSPYVNVFLTNILEYKYKEPTENSRCWNSGFGNDHENVYRIIQENGWEYTHHNGSKWDYDDYTQQYIDILNGWIKTIMNEKLLYSANNMEEIKKVFTKIFNAVNIWNGFSFAGQFSDEEQFKIICDRVREETGIDLSSFAGTEIQKHFDWLTKENNPKLVVSDYIARELRMRALKEKLQTKKLTEEDKFELHYYEEFGEYANITPDEKQLLTYLEEISYKTMEELSKDELTVLMQATNFKLQNLSKLAKDENYSFEVKYIKEITEEQAASAAEVGVYLKPRKGLYLTVEMPDDRAKFSKVSGIDIVALEDKINMSKTHMETYFLEKELANIPNCHLFEFLCGLRSITDCDLSSCKTVDDFETSIMRYSELFSKFISGQEVQFDSLGNSLTNEDYTINIETQVRNALQSGVRSSTISAVERQSQAMENEKESDKWGIR